MAKQLEHALQRLAHVLSTSTRDRIVVGIRKLDAEITELEEPGNDLLLYL